ncbi:MAG: hypothetical protein M3457_08840 [Chloroflexota bacterium]|nr:hypothetical protein [Chloroflexota bacterium]
MTRSNLPDIASAMAALLQTPNVSVAWSVRLADGHGLAYCEDVPVEAGSTFKAVAADFWSSRSLTHMRTSVDGPTPLAHARRVSSV